LFGQPRLGLTCQRYERKDEDHSNMYAPYSFLIQEMNTKAFEKAVSEEEGKKTK
jgi:hypothetical protein